MLSMRKRYVIGAQSNISLKCLSINDENKLLEVVRENCKHGMSMLDSLLFLSLQNTCMATSLRFDSLYSTCFECVYHHEDKGRHHLKMEDVVKELSGDTCFEPEILLLMKS